MRILTGVIVSLLLALSHARAEPMLPPKAAFSSANGQFRLTVFPRPLSDPIAYTQKACGARVEEPSEPARARMERRVGSGDAWTEIWAGPLPNEISPTRALVSDDGRYAVTFGNWNSVDRDEDGSVSIAFGYWQLLDYGDNVLVIYDGRGRLIRSLALKDLLPGEWIEALQWSFSEWARGYGLSADGARLALEVVIPPEEKLGHGGEMAIELDLATGRPIPPDGPKWQAALAQAARVAAAARAEKAEYARRLVAPLMGPGSADEGEWYAYLVEAVRRLREGGPPVAKVLPAPGSPDFVQEAAIISTILNRKPDGLNTYVFGSPSQEALAELFESAARRIRPGRLKGGRIYVATGDAMRGRFAAALAHTGVELVQVDPSKPIPQRPNRLAEEKELSDMFSCILLGS